MTLASHTPATWDNILSTTMANYRKTLTDNVFNTRPLLQHLMGAGRVQEAPGGHSIVEPLMYSEGEADSYAEWDQISVTPQNTATAAQFPWKLLYATIAISGLEEAQNSGPEQIVNLLEAKVNQAEETLKNRLNGFLFGTYSSSTTANDFLSLPEIIADAATSCGGIVNESWWAAGSISSGVGNNGITGAVLEDRLRNAVFAASDAGPDGTDAIFTNPYGFGFYESTLTPQVRYTDTTKANLGFQNLMFKNIPMMWDFQCSGGTEGTTATNSASFYGINSKYVGLKIHKDRNFKQSPFSDNLSGSVASASGAGIGSVSADAMDARVSFITTYGNLCTRNRRRHWKVTDVTEA